VPRWALRLALWAPLVIAAVLAGGYVYMHDPFARDGTELLQVPLSEEDPELDRVGDLKFLGGLDIPRMDQNIGGLSGLRWDAESGRLLAITDDARWVWITLEEDADRLFGIDQVESGPLIGIDGEPLAGKQEGDSESLRRDPEGSWTVGFERDHRILLYTNGLLDRPFQSSTDPSELFGGLSENNGLEAMALGAGGSLYCAETSTTSLDPNCAIYRTGSGFFEGFHASPPEQILDRGPVPTDADAFSDGTFVILFRSYSPTDGNSAAIVSYTPDGTRRDIATLLPPLTLDNFEGLAVREEGGRTFLYIVSDDNFSGSQRTLLMKFEVLTENQ